MTQPIETSDDLVKVRTTFHPDTEMEVTRAEALDLERQGLLIKAENTEETRHGRQHD